MYRLTQTTRISRQAAFKASDFQQCSMARKPFSRDLTRQYQPVYNLDKQTLRKYSHNFSHESCVRKKTKLQVGEQSKVAYALPCNKDEVCQSSMSMTTSMDT